MFILYIYGLLQFLPDFLDIIVPLNESRKHQLVCLVEFFVDQERYFYPIVTHNILANFVGGMSIFSTSGMTMGFVLHVCAMLKIAR